MMSGKHWGWALPGLLVATVCMAQTPSGGSKAAVHKQLEQVRQEVKSQQAQAHDLKQKIREARQRNTADQASLKQRDQEIARLKAELAHQQAKASPSPAASAAGGKGHGN